MNNKTMIAQSLSGNKIKITTADGSVEYRITVEGSRLIINAASMNGDAQRIAACSGVGKNELNIFAVADIDFYA